MDQRISVKATAGITRKPDHALISLFVWGHGILMSDALDAVERREKEVTTALREQFLWIQEIHISNYKMGEKSRRYSDENSPSQPEVIRLLLVQTPPDLKLIAAILDYALRAKLGIQSPGLSSWDNGSSVYYAVDDSGAAKEALLAAVDNARIKAQDIAARLGRKIGRNFSIPHSEEYNAWNNEFRSSPVQKFVRSRFCSTDPTRVEIAAYVTAEFELE